MGAVTVKVDADGTLVIPKELRERLGITGGGELRGSSENLRHLRLPTTRHQRSMG